VRKMMATFFASALLFAGFAGGASAQVEQDGLVNVNIGDITVEDVNVAVAAQIVANVCANVDLDAAVAIIGEIDAGDLESEQFCRIGRGVGSPTLEVTQN
jgi:hypothetical protein